MTLRPMTNPQPIALEERAIRNGILAGMIAYVLWGFFPFYFKATSDVSAVEMLAHRIVWSLPFGALIITLRRQWGEVLRTLKNARFMAWLALAAVMIAVNWGVYIWAVQADFIMQASLGYYITPLTYVLVGVVFLKETLSRPQLIAVIMAAIGVSILTLQGGEFPWISLTLAISFTTYGVVRKQVVIGAMPGLFVEVIILFPVAAAYVAWMMTSGQSLFAAPGQGGLTGLLLLAGPITVLPLLAFALAARRLPLSTIGFLQFIAPTIQFLCALYYGEPFTPGRMICFAFIWGAAIVFSYGLWSASKRNRKSGSITL